jgi:hypothetical protein
VAVAVLCGATLLHLARQRGVPVRNSLWAENGRVFLSDAIRDFPGTLLDQNGGYIHVVPRLVGGVVAALPVSGLFLPLALVAPVVRRSRRGSVVTAVFLAGLVVQYAIISGGAHPERN